MINKILKRCADKTNPKYELRNPFLYKDYIIATDTRILIAVKQSEEIPKVSGVWIPNPKNETITLAKGIDKDYIMNRPPHIAYINGLQYSMRGTIQPLDNIIPSWFLNGETPPNGYKIIKNINDIATFMYAVAQEDYIVNPKLLQKLVFDKTTIYVHKRNEKDNNEQCLDYTIFFKDDSVGYFGAIMPLCGVNIKELGKQ